MSEYKDHSKEFKRRFLEHVEQACNKTAMQIYRDAKLNISGHNSPALFAVDTGRLMNSISAQSSESGQVPGADINQGGRPPVQKGEEEVKATTADKIKEPEQKRGVISCAIGSNVVYAPVVELGASYMGDYEGKRVVIRQLRPRPFLRTALEMNKNTFAKHLKFNPDSMGTSTK